MTNEHQTSSSARAAQSLHIFVVHGLPRRGEDPFSRLEQLRTALRIPQTNWHKFEWATSPIAAARARARLQNRQFGIFYPPHFADWLHRERASLPSEAKVIIIAYSAGGFIVLKWLADLASEEDAAIIAAVFCLGSPYRFFQPEQDFYFEDMPNEPPVTVREDSLQPRLITSKLRPWQLIIVLAGLDRTIPRWNAVWPRWLTQSKVDEHIVRRARHLNLCGQPNAISYVTARILGTL